MPRNKGLCQRVTRLRAQEFTIRAMLSLVNHTTAWLPHGGPRLKRSSAGSSPKVPTMWLMVSMSL